MCMKEFKLTTDAENLHIYIAHKPAYTYAFGCIIVTGQGP